MIRIFIFTCCFLFAFQEGFSQSEPKSLYFAVQGAYNTGVGKIKVTDTLSLRNEGSLFRMRLSAGVYLKQHWSAGLGFGLESFNNPSFNFMPVALESRYWVGGENKPLLVSGAVGYSLPGATFTGGLYAHLGGGFRFFESRKSEAAFNVGYELHQARDAFHDSISRKNALLQSISFSIAIIFR